MTSRLKTRFIIETTGRTGSQYLASLLSSHPDVFCAHGPDFDFESQKGSFHLDLKRLERIHRNIRKWHKSDPSIFFARMEEACSASAVGCIHGFLCQDSRRIQTGDRTIREARITRHPAARIDSFIERHKWEIAGIPYSRNMHLRHHQLPWGPLRRAFRLLCGNRIPSFMYQPKHLYLKPLHENSLGVPLWLTIEDSLFIDAMARVLSADSNIDASPYRTLKFEDLTGSADTLNEFCRWITGGTGTEAEWHDLITGQDHIDRRASNSKLTEQDRFNRWKAWQQKLYLYTVRQLHLESLYIRLGYAVSPGNGC